MCFLCVCVFFFLKTGEYLRLWSVPENDGKIELKGLLNNVKKKSKPLSEMELEFIFFPRVCPQLALGGM